MTSEPAEIDGLLDRLRAGDTAALGTLWGYYRPRLQRFVRLRMDNRMAARVGINKSEYHAPCLRYIYKALSANHNTRTSLSLHGAVGRLFCFQLQRRPR